MSKTTTPLGRLAVRVPDFHFDVDDDYGVALFNTLNSAWELISDNIGTRYFGARTIAAGAIASIDHNFGLHLTKLALYYFQSGSQLTKAQAAAKFSPSYVNSNTFTIQNLSSASETFDLNVLSWKFDNPGQIDLTALQALTVNRALLSDATGKIGVSPTTATELGYVAGARSNIQNQIDNAQPTNAAISSALVWATGEDYVVDQIVVIEGAIWACITGHTSSAAFNTDIAKWELLGSSETKYTVHTATTILDSSANGMQIASSASAIDFTLPSATADQFKTYHMKNIGAGLVSVKCTGVQTIEGLINIQLAKYESLNVVSDGGNWFII